MSECTGKTVKVLAVAIPAKAKVERMREAIVLLGVNVLLLLLLLCIFQARLNNMSLVKVPEMDVVVDKVQRREEELEMREGELTLHPDRLPAWVHLGPSSRGSRGKC